MSEIHSTIEFSEIQAEAFFGTQAKYNFYPKGRRVGFTRGGIQASIEWALEGHSILWGDTINENIRKYIERYAVPLMEAQGIPYDWNKNNKVIKFASGGYIDFRSADKPENWEGFGYDFILLNEAGIILEGTRGEYLYQNSVLPMLMDNPRSQLFAFGVPKGKATLYYKLCQRAVSGERNYHTRTYSSYDTPYLYKSVVQDLEKDMFELGGKLLVDQEIYGKFTTIQGSALSIIQESWVLEAQARWKEITENAPPAGYAQVMGVDVGRGGRDPTVFAPRIQDYIRELEVYTGQQAKTGPEVAALLLPKLDPDMTRANIDVVGVGSSPFDAVKQKHDKTYAVNGGLRGVSGKDRAKAYGGFFNLRAKLYWKLKEALDPAYGATLALPPDEALLVDLVSTQWEPSGDLILIEKKEKIVERIGRSPDRGDAVTYSLYEPPPPRVPVFARGG